MEKIVAAGVHFSASGHARHRPYVEVLELAGTLGETSEIGGLHPFVAIRGHEVATKGVVHDHHDTFAFERWWWGH